MLAGAGWWVRALALAFAAVMAVGAQAQRLPPGVTPEHYSLTITPDLQRAGFTGEETIDIVLAKPADAITLNALDIDFAAVKAASIPPTGEPTTWQTAAVSEDFGAQQATFRLPTPLPAGPVRLAISYSGAINDKLRGFYLSRSKDHLYGVTQFEATDARRAFPSFDEPALKATFDVTLVIDAADSAISNTEQLSDQPGPVAGKHTVRFATTPKMSTYLVAWLVGQWGCSDGKSEGIPIRVCATPDKLRLTRFALEAAKWDLKYYDRYFGIKYPLKKMDLVAIPDFEAGAMENFGCLTFRETELLVDEKDGPIAALKEVASTVAHEISHQWFGDMVTMQWWDNIWLNEGFATWMESKASAAWRPEWNVDQDVAVDLGSTMDLDARPATRAIRTSAETPEEIDALFDGIAYGKAGAVIGMVENWVGEEVFRRGVQDYLRAHLYSTATAEDFWNAQTRTSGLPVDAVMRSFVEQPGLPVVSVGDVVDAKAPVSQNRFLLQGTDDTATAAHPSSDTTAQTRSPTPAQETWTLPLCFKAAPCIVVGPETADVPVPAGFVFADAQDKGYYRTAYTAPERAALEAGVETRLSAPERIGLLSDRWALMRAGTGTVGQYLDLALAVKDDRNAPVLDRALGRIEEIGRRIATDPQRERLNAVVRTEFGPVYAALGPGDKHDGWQKDDLRSTLYEALGEAGDPAVMAEAQRITTDLLSGHHPKDDAVADASVALVAQHGDAAMYDKMVAVAQSSADPGLKTDALHLLTRFEEPLLVIRTLEYALSDDVRSQDAWALIALELNRRSTQDLAWQFVQQHWTAISAKLTVSGAAGVLEATGAFCSAESRAEVAEFFAAHPVGPRRSLDQALESIDECVRLRRQQQPELTRWLDSHVPPAAPPPQ